MTDLGRAPSAALRLGPTPNAAQLQRWNGASGRYWLRHRKRHLAEHRRLTPHLFRAARITPGTRVLDIGCGCGDTTIAAARDAKGTEKAATQGEPPHTGLAVGLDLSAPMLKAAQQLAEQSGTANVRFIQGDAQVCPLNPKSFDIVISHFGVMFFDKPDVAFKNIATVLRPGGRLAFLCWQDDGQNEGLAIPLREFGAHMELPDRGINDLFDSQQIENLLKGTGWEDIQITPVKESVRVGSDVDDVMSYIRGMPSIDSLSTNLKDPAKAGKILDKIAEQYARYERPDGVWVWAAAWLVTALHT